MRGKNSYLYLVWILAILLNACQTRETIAPSEARKGQQPTQLATSLPITPVRTMIPHQAAPAFITKDCWFEIPAGIRVTCGTVDVLEDRSNPGGKTLKLAVAIFHSTSATPAPDPVVYHVGGPGGHMLNVVPHIYHKVIAPFLERGDLILFDPRGTGYSQPAFECREGENPGDCVRRWFAAGHNLYAYNSLSMAQDLQDLRAALGYDRWNLLGESYGAHVAQIVLKFKPDGLRSVILDSVMPVVPPPLPQGKSSTEVAMHRLFQRCEADVACRAAFPNLPATVEKAWRQLDEHPVRLRTTCYGEAKETLLTGPRLGSMIHNALYETELIPGLPAAIAALAGQTGAGSDYAFWENMLCWEATIDLLLTRGAHLATLCGDGLLGSECEDWPVAYDLVPVRSDLPVLVLSGEFDPQTPLEYGQSVAESLPNSYVFDFPGFGHWVNGTGHPCQCAIIRAFLDNPDRKPDGSCLGDLTNFTFLIPGISNVEEHTNSVSLEPRLLEMGRQVSEQQQEMPTSCSTTAFLESLSGR